MNKRAQKSLNMMDEPTKLEALMLLHLSMTTPSIVLLELEEGVYVSRYSEYVTREKFLSMIGDLMVRAAKTNDETPIKLLADLGEKISEIMTNEKSERTKAADKSGTKAGE